MITLKDITIEVLKKLPPSATLEEIMYKINLTSQVLEGLKDAEQGKTTSTEDLLNQIGSWSK